MARTEEDELEDDSETGKAARQRRWRRRARSKLTPKKTGASVAMHFTDAECARLDAIAAVLYRDNPHDPRKGIKSDVFPGRAEAIRYLIREHRSRVEMRTPGSRDECGEFWRAEASWRRVRDSETELEPPRPPWYRP